MRINPSIGRAAALALAGAAASAMAVPVANLDARASTAHVSYFGGFAIAGDDGSDGDPAPLTSLVPSALALGGSHTYVGSYLSWDVTYTVNWQLAQDYAVDAAAHTISGAGSLHLDETSAVVGPNCAPCAATVSITGTNTQALEFSLSEATPYAFHSDTTIGQWVEVQVWNEPAQRWFALWSGPSQAQGVAFDSAGTLDPGRYRVQNDPYSFTADGVPPEQTNAWSYTLTLPDAQITAVPEPGTAGLWALGGAALLAARRRRVAARD